MLDWNGNTFSEQESQVVKDEERKRFQQRLLEPILLLPYHETQKGKKKFLTWTPGVRTVSLFEAAVVPVS
jgi:hypothetical protein